MKKQFYLYSIFIALLISCSDSSTTPGNYSPETKVKITIFRAEMNDSNSYDKIVEYFLDGDRDGYMRRTFLANRGTKKEGVLSQGYSNCPLPLFKYGCLLKEIDYRSDTSIYCINTFEYDNEGYMAKVSLDFYNSSNKSGYAIYQRSGNRLMKSIVYKENILDRTMEFIYGKNGYIEKQIDSNMTSKSSYYTYFRYNDKNECIYKSYGKDSSYQSISIYYYDDNGYNIKTKSFEINGKDTTYQKEYNKIVYKGYLIAPEDLNKFKFDANDNIIEYKSTDFPAKFRIEYEFK
ncbi:MAG: hypothetical protein HW421_3243 [Ignavibacteria bacterium]|nr:hypothetical protein [Ignavibacteria bacterium]